MVWGAFPPKKFALVTSASSNLKVIQLTSPSDRRRLDSGTKGVTWGFASQEDFFMSICQGFEWALFSLATFPLEEDLLYLFLFLFKAELYLKGSF